MAGSFTFNGVRKNYLFVLLGFSRPAWAPIERDILKVPAKAGGYLLQTNTDVRTIKVPVVLKSSAATMQKTKEDLANWLVTDNPCELIFDDEPDRTYIAVIDGEDSLEELIFRGKGELIFICPNPYKLGAVQTKQFQNNVDGNLQADINNPGSVESNPVIDITVGAQSPFLDVWNGDDYFRLGYPTAVKTKVVKQDERLIWDEMNNLATWTAVTGTMGIYKCAGSMALQGNYAFKPASYGTGAADEWHGPFMKRDLPSNAGTVQDFRADMVLTFKSSNYNQMGKVVIVLLDANDKPIVEIGMADEYMSHEVTTGQAIIDPGASRKWIVDEAGNGRTAFNNFFGHVSLARRGKEWSFYFARYRNGTQIDDASSVHRWRDDSDSNPMTARPVAKIAIGCIAYGANPPANMAYIEDVKFWKINTLNVDETPYIFDVGDKIRIDTERSLVTINGKNVIGLKDIFSRFPSVKRGANAIIVRPYNVGSAQITYREMYK